MKFLTLFVSSSLLLALASASAVHRIRSDTVSARHAKVARSVGPSTRSVSKRCKAKPKPTSSSNSTSTHHSTTTHKPKSTSTAAAPKSTSPTNGVIDVTTCGATGATPKTSQTSGPNGSIDFLNNGITGSGWQPCHITVDQLVAQDLSTAINQPGTPYGPCAQFIDLFNKHGEANGLPPILLAAIAMQESSCQPGAVGPGNSQGLMQITTDKCDGKSDADCRDPDFNIGAGASFFANTLAGNNGGVLETMGNYNGWDVGMTEAQATAARNSGCCLCQNNLDYLDQVFNGWLQNVDGSGLGKFFNLNDC